MSSIRHSKKEFEDAKQLGKDEFKRGLDPHALAYDSAVEKCAAVYDIKTSGNTDLYLECDNDAKEAYHEAKKKAKKD
jgi:hypothetical protein